MRSGGDLAFFEVVGVGEDSFGEFVVRAVAGGVVHELHGVVDEGSLTVAESTGCRAAQGVDDGSKEAALRRGPETRWNAEKGVEDVALGVL